MMYGGNGSMWDGYGWDWGGWIMMTIVMVLVFAAVITAIVLAIRYLGGSHATTSRPSSYGQSSPEDVLAGRFARGEIDEDEFRRRMTALREHR